MLKNILLIIAAVCFSCCCTTKDLTQNSRLDYNISFGSGGGFTGIHNAYYADSSGSIYYAEGKILLNTDKKYYGKIGAEQIEKINRLTLEIIEEKVELSDRGDLTSFFTISNATQEYKFTWSGEGEGSLPDNKIKSKITEIEKIIRTLK